MSDPSIRCKTFGDIVSIATRRGRIRGAVESVDQDLIKGYVNEYYVKICGMRKWQWRNCDRTFLFKPAVDSTTLVNASASVTQYNRVVTFTNLTLDQTYVGRSIRFNNQSELYRILGVKTSTNQAYLDSAYSDDTDADASFKIFQYEFALPPDCDSPNQLYLMKDSFSEENEIDFKSLLEFNRMLSTNSSMSSITEYYTVDGKTYANISIPPLDQQLLDWDFLGGKVTDKVDRIRFFPIEPDKARVIRMSYTLFVKELENDNDEPILPPDTRWMLVHYALYEWFKGNGQQITASKEKSDGDALFKMLANDYRKSQTPPKFIVDSRNNHRDHNYGRGRRLLNTR